MSQETHTCSYIELILYSYGSTRRYYEVYPCLTDLLLVLQSLFWYFGSYPDITEHIHVFRILYMYYRTYTCILDLMHVLQSIYLSYRFYTCFVELIVVLRILFLCKGTRRYDNSEQIRIISHTRSYQTSTDTDISLSYVQITDSLYGSARRYYWTSTYFTELILIFRYESTRGYYRTDTEVLSDLYSYSLFNVLSYVCLTT